MVAVFLQSAWVLVFKSRTSAAQDYVRGGTVVQETPDCALGAAVPASFDMNFHNAFSLVKFGRVQALLHKDEGCLRTNQELRFAGIARDKNDLSKILRRHEFGWLRISKITKVPFQDLDRPRQKHLSRKLSLPRRRLRGRQFLVVEAVFVRASDGERDDDDGAEEWNELDE
jgi:hypothetical protein